MYIGICDDELDCQQSLRQYINGQDCAEPITYLMFSTLQQLLQCTQPLDLLFLDIEVGQDNSLVLLAQKDKLPDVPTIVLISSHPCYVTQSYHASVFQFLLKPLQPDLFAQVFHNCYQRYRRLQQYCELRDESGHSQQLPLRQIVCVKYKLRRIVYYDENQHQYFGTEPSLLAAWQKLHPFGFVQIHKGCLVNLAYVTDIQPYQVTVQFKHTLDKLPIGKTYREATWQQYLQYMLETKENSHWKLSL